DAVGHVTRRGGGGRLLAVAATAHSPHVSGAARTYAQAADDAGPAMAHALSRRTGGVAAPQGAGGSSTAGPPAEPSLRDQAVGAIARASNLFARDLYQVLSKQTGNLLVSPLSASAVLALTWLGSARQTAQQLGSALHLPQDYQHVIYGYRALFNSFQLSESTTLLLANAVYFKGTWQTKFDSTLTSEQPFRTPKAMAAAAAAKAADPAKAGDALRSNARTVALMSVTGDFPYARLPDLEAQALRLPYVGDRVSMLVLLPDAVDGLPRLEAALSKLEVSTVLAQLHVEEVNVWFPRFSLHTTVPLNGALQENNVTL
ncbi:Seminal fluid protein HACP059, partial [Gryllus bimaculatus]